MAYGAPAEAISTAKAARIRRLAIRWLDEFRETLTAGQWPELRFDVVSVLRARRGAASVEHIEAAF
jgi:putative endonuclease